jgi:hypothetical protein
MGQLVRHNFISTNRLMASKPFVTGFNEVRNKKSYQYDRFKTDSELWAYERGRQFAMCYIGPLKIGHSVCVQAEAMFNHLARAGILI